MIRMTLPALLLGLSLSGCVGSTYSGPVEVTRFVSEASTPIGQAEDRGQIAITFPEAMRNERARDAFYNAVARELTGLGYTVIDQAQPGVQSARVMSTRSELAAASSRGPVSVGLGGSTGSYGSGLGLGIGINLGGNTAKPNALTKLSVRISDAQGNSVWEGRAQQAVSINSPYAGLDASAGALAQALFKDFPGGNGETVSIKVKDLQDPE